MPRYKKQKEEFREQLYDARAIFQEAERVVTPEWVAWLKHHWQEESARRSLGGFAWAIERQSLGLSKLGDPNHTGHIARVQAILRLADLHRLYLIPPTPRAERRAGEPPFIFDPRVWYVDGEDEKSTGFSPSPEVRPRLWMLYAVLRQVNRIDPTARPSAIIIADEVRFLRADHAIKEWYRAIKHEGVDLIFPDSGRVLADHLDMLAMKVRVASAHLQFYRDQSREVARQQGRVPWGRALTGTRWEDGGRRLVADPDWWPKLAAVVERLATGQIGSQRAVPAYLRETYGEGYVLTVAGFRKLLKHETIFDGYYDAFTRKYDPCLIRERYGNRFDFSFTASRVKRYVVEPTPAETHVRKAVEHPHGTVPMDPVLVAEARRRTSVLGRPSRREDEEARWQIVPTYLLRCAAPGCGASVQERAGLPPERRAGKKGVFCEWHVRCLAGKQSREREGTTPAQFRAKLADDGHEHRQVVLGSVSLALVPLLRAHLFDPALITPADLEERPVAVAEEQARLELAREQVLRRLRVQTLTLEDLDPAVAPDVYQGVRVRMGELQEELRGHDRALNQLAARELGRAEHQRGLARARADYQKAVETHGHDPAFWAAIVRTFVSVIRVDLGGGDLRRGNFH